MRKIVWPDATPLMAELYAREGAAILPGVEVHLGPRRGPALAPYLREADAAILFDTWLDADTLAACTRLRRIQVLSTGFAGHLDLAAAARLGVRVEGVRGYGDRTIAEHALALLLAAARRVAEQDRAIRQGGFEPLAHWEIEGKRLAVIGLGGAGRAMARMAAALGMEVVAWNRTPDAAAGLPVTPAPLDEALAGADAVSLHLLLTPETERILDARRLALLKPSCILVNTARGKLIDEPALVAALASGRLLAAGLDVFADEPLAPGHPLTRLENVTLTAHAAWMGPAAASRLLRLGLERLAAE